MTKLLKLYRFLNVLSIDVALGAVCSSAWFANYFQVPLRIYAYIALGIAVWIIYTADHLLDARRIKQMASSYRHRFHQTNFWILIVAITIAILAECVLLLYIRQTVFYSGLLLSGIIAGYLLFNRWVAWLKEFFVALLYCGGILLPVISIGGAQILSQNIIVILAFFITTFINTVLFSWFDLENDKADSQQSLVTRWGDVVTRKLIWSLFGIQFVLGLYGVIVMSLMFSVMGIFFAMNGVLLIIFLNRRWFSVNDKYRMAGDAIFLFPLFFIESVV